MGSVRSAGRGFFPLDEELGLLRGLDPPAARPAPHLGSWMPFAPAAALLARFSGVVVSPATARRLTEVVGAPRSGVAGRGNQLVEDLPPVPPGPARAVVSVDGAMVPLRGGEWGEVKTLVVGEVPCSEPAIPASLPAQGHTPTVPEVHTTALSYCSRLADVEQFNEAVLLELHRRGVENAGQVAAVSDGAEWIQGFVDLHCPQAVRILDFAHAAQRVALIGQTLAPDDPDWLTRHLHHLKHTGPEPLLAQWQVLVVQGPDAPRGQGGPRLSGQAPGAAAVSRLSGSRVAHRQWDRGEWQQPGRGSPPQRGGHALGASQRQPAAGIAQCRCNQRWEAHGRAESPGAPPCAAPLSPSAQTTAPAAGRSLSSALHPSLQRRLLLQSCPSPILGAPMATHSLRNSDAHPGVCVRVSR